MAIILDSDLDTWNMRTTGLDELMEIYEKLKTLDKGLSDIEDTINRHEEMMKMRYTELELNLEIEKSEEKADKHKSYASKVHSYLEDTLESYSKSKIESSLELLSRASDLGRYETADTLGGGMLTPKTGLDGLSGTFVDNPMVLGFADFVPSDEDWLTGDFSRGGIVEQLYRKEYEQIKMDLYVEGQESLSLKEYNEMILYSTSFDYKKEYNWQNFVSDILSASVVYPLITGAVGYDPIMGYSLTGKESRGRVYDGTMGTAMLLISYGTAPAGLTVAQTVGYVGKNVGIGMIGSGVSSYSNYTLVKIGVPEQNAAVISSVAGIATGVYLGRVNYKEYAQIGQQNIAKAAINSQQPIDPKVKNKLNSKQERRMNRGDFEKYQKEMEKSGINARKEIKDELRHPITGEKTAGGFKADTEEIILEKRPTILAGEHESFHAKQYKELGKKAYVQQSTLEKEEYVYQEILKSKTLTLDEKYSAERYIYYVRHGNQWPPENWIGSDMKALGYSLD